MKTISIKDFMCLNTRVDTPVQPKTSGNDEDPWLNGGYPLYIYEVVIVPKDDEEDKNEYFDWGHIYWPKEYRDQPVYYGYYQEVYGYTESQGGLFEPDEELFPDVKLGEPGITGANGQCGLVAMAFELGLPFGDSFWNKLDEVLLEHYPADDGGVSALLLNAGDHSDTAGYVYYSNPVQEDPILSQLNARGKEIRKNLRNAQTAGSASATYLREIAELLGISHVFDDMSDAILQSRIDKGMYGYINAPNAGGTGHMRIIYGYGIGTKTSYLYFYVWDTIRGNMGQRRNDKIRR